MVTNRWTLFSTFFQRNRRRKQQKHECSRWDLKKQEKKWATYLIPEITSKGGGLLSKRKDISLILHKRFLFLKLLLRNLMEFSRMDPKKILSLGNFQAGLNRDKSNRWCVGNAENQCIAIFFSTIFSPSFKQGWLFSHLALVINIVFSFLFLIVLIPKSLEAAEMEPWIFWSLINSANHMSSCYSVLEFFQILSTATSSSRLLPKGSILASK